MGRPGTFQKGNKAAVGHKGVGPARSRIITQCIVAKLNEIDPKTKREHVFRLVDELFEQAYARETPMLDPRGKQMKDADGKKLTVRVLGDLSAKKEIIDRAEGKPVQGHSLDSEGGGRVTIVFEAEDEKL